MSLDEATQKVVERIAKLFSLAEKNPNPEEAASAAAKAQELLLAYNLDMTVIETNAGASGKRLDERVTGGAYKYQQRLWSSIAELNFCFYWTMKVRVRDPNSYAAKRKRRFTSEHRLVGRQLNVISTRNTGSYLEQTINRLCIERLGEEGRSNQFYSSWAMAYREGIADAVIRKIRARRQEAVDEEDRKRDEAVKAAKGSASTATTLTIAGLSDREEAANYDFLHGEGAWAKKEEAAAQWEKDWEKRRKRQAAAQAEAEKEYAAWALANPKEAAKEAAAELRKQRRRESRPERQRYFRPTGEDLRRDSGAYYSGLEVGKKVSIDQQAGTTNNRRIASG